jgi:hypothetical protein
MHVTENTPVTASGESAQPATSRITRHAATTNEIWAIAALLKDGTKAAARRALIAHNRRSRETDIDAVLTAEKVVRGRREGRLFARPKSRPSLIQRLETVRSEAVATVARQTFRHGAAGGHTMNVVFVDSSAQVSYTVVMDRNWDTYRGAFKGWAANEDHHTIAVPIDWRTRVQRRGLATLGGMMTLDAHPLQSFEGVQVFLAKWASQGRGFDVKVHQGYIALSGEEHFHAETHEQAIRGLHRKRSSAERVYFDRYNSSVDEFVKCYGRYKIAVTLDDARMTGSCEYGIRSWCETTGLPYDDGRASMQQVLTAFRAAPQIEVRRAILEAVRKHRSEVRRA